MQQERKVYTENAEQEQWQMLLNYSYPANIGKFVQTELSDDVKQVISGSLYQAKEYFQAANSMSLFTSPLLLYYGVSNLFIGVCTLLQKKKLCIKNHGMYLLNENLSDHSLGDISFTAKKNSEGALFHFVRTMDDFELLHSSKWSIKDVFSSIPDLMDDFENIYTNDIFNCLPIEIVKRRQNSLERIHKARFKNVEDKKCFLEKVEGLMANYIVTDTDEYFVLRKKLKHEEICIDSLSGQKFLKVPHNKNHNVLNFSTLIHLYMGLFALGSLSRYHPGMWNKFIQSDISGERLIVERFLNICKRYIPNLLLNKLENVDIKFTNEQKGIIDFTKEVSNEDIEELVLKKINEALDDRKS